MADLKTHDLQALAFHMFTRCKEQRAAFDECMDSADKSSKCSEQYKALTSCTASLCVFAFRCCVARLLLAAACCCRRPPKALVLCDDHSHTLTSNPS
jgi:hypothetical protein